MRSLKTSMSTHRLFQYRIITSRYHQTLHCSVLDACSTRQKIMFWVSCPTPKGNAQAERLIRVSLLSVFARSQTWSFSFNAFDTGFCSLRRHVKQRTPDWNMRNITPNHGRVRRALWHKFVDTTCNPPQCNHCTFENSLMGVTRYVGPSRPMRRTCSENAADNTLSRIAPSVAVSNNLGTVQHHR